MPLVIGGKVRQLRVDRGLTQRELAEDCSVTKRTIQLVENDPNHRLKRRTLDHLSIALEVPAEALLRREPPRMYDPAGAAVDEAADDFLSWPKPLFNFVRRTTVPGPRAVCGSSEETREAAAAMRRAWGEHLDRFADPDQSRGLFEADRRLNENFADYERRYLSLWRANPRCLLYACVAGRRTGVSAVLPVTDEAYESMRCGERHFMQITADDVLPESQNLILDSLVEIPGDVKASWYQLTSSLSFTLFFQLSMLSIDPVDPRFRMLSFGASPMNVKRLEGVALSPVGTRMPVFDFPLYEFGLDPDRGEDAVTSRAVTSSYLARLFRQRSRRGGVKQTLIRRALRLYRPIAKRHVSDRLRSVA